MARKAKKVLTAEEAERAAEQARRDARAKYHTILELAQTAQEKFPKLYLLDENISIQNAADGLKENEGVTLSAFECDWTTICYEYVARNIENDTAMRIAEAGLNPSDFGLRY